MFNINVLKELLPFSNSLNILFVEDNNIVRDQTIKMLKKIFQNIDSANNGKEGLLKYNNFNENNNSFYDIVITDLSMPIMNGVELSKEILNKNSSQKLIILSAHTESKEFISLRNLRNYKFIQKPIEQEALLDTLLGTIKELKTIHN